MAKRIINTRFGKMLVQTISTHAYYFYEIQSLNGLFCTELESETRLADLTSMDIEAAIDNIFH